MYVPTSGFMNMHNLKILWLSSVSWYIKFRNVEFSWKAQYFVEYPFENGSVRGTNFIKMEMQEFNTILYSNIWKCKLVLRM